MGKKYTTDEIEVGGHMLDASMMSGLNTIVSAGSHTLAGYLTTYTDTTYSVGNGGLTEINFTSALNTKLAGIATGANNYVLPFTNNSANWNTAYGWGNHAGLYAAASHSHSYLPLAGGTITGNLVIDGSLDVTDDWILVDNNRGLLNSGSWNRLQTPYGNIDFGPANVNHAHIYTDRPDFYFNKSLTVNGSSVVNTSDIRAKIFYDVDNTAYYLDPASTSNLNAVNSLGGVTFTNFGIGVTGTYASTRLQTIFNMGASYKISSGGDAVNNAYGLYWSHQNAGTLGGANNLASHGLIILEGGTYKGSWGGGRLVTTGDVRAPLFYDSNNTAYYLDPAGTSVQANIQADYIGAGIEADTSGSYKLNMGGSILMNNNNINYLSQLHFNANVRFYQDSNDSYLNFKYGDATTGGIKFLNGGGTVKGYVFANAESFGLLDSTGNWAVKTAVGAAPLTLYSNANPEFYVYDSYTYSPGSSRAPIFYDSNNTAYYLNPYGYSNLQGMQIGSGDLKMYENGTYSSELRFQNNTHHMGIDYQNNETLRFITRSGVTTVPITFQMRAGTITAANFILSSDERKKTKIVDLPCNNIDVSWKSFEMKDNEGEYRTGVIAQELEQKHPEFVNTDNEGFKSVKYIDLLIAKIAELEARLEKLEK